MKWIISRYNHDLSYLSDYTNDYVLYDRSDKRDVRGIYVPNIGTDLFDKFTYIIEHYNSLPDVAIYTKANLFKYITKEEFDKVKESKIFTPLLTQNHKTYSDANGIVCYYYEGMYFERNDYWYLNSHPARFPNELIHMFGMDKRSFNAFAPGSNYILPKKNILKHPISLYKKLRHYLQWDVYPGDAMLIERNLYYLWR